ncbi:MAG: lipoyl(octanoyl) transferase LipB, partial [Candidatus Omnitrophota bacterium]|nr:lipoyl(octanoyl) transferase LipB [Candidatus Omnitrophota bacterium]
MKIEIFDLGLAPYKEAWDFQKTVFARVKAGEIPSALILCRHLPVITLGRRADEKNILADKDELTGKKIELFRVERGGDVTYHGPGQLTVYPIFNLKYFKKDIHWFLRYLENITVEFLSSFGVKAEVRPGLTGVWVGQEKIASIG